MAEDDASYLQIYLAPLLEPLTRPDITDLYINQPGEIWIETLGGATERINAPQVTEEQLWRLARQVARITHQGISREHPLLAARLPDGARVQIVAPPATRGPMAVAIRKHVTADLSLADYESGGAFAQTSAGDDADDVERELGRLYEAQRWREFLAAAVKARKTIIVSGGTSTGKTTFLNALLREIEPAERLIVIEDTPELLVRHTNAVGLVAVRGQLGEATVTANDLLISALRMRPDRIILGELRGQEAFAFLRAINTGHPGSLTSIHADSVEGAIEQLVLLVLQGSTQLRGEDVRNYVAGLVDVVVQLRRTAGRREVSYISWRERS